MPKSKSGRPRRQRRSTKSSRQETSTPLSPEAMEVLKKQRPAFIEKFGREPAPGDPVFFDPDAEEPTSRDADAVHQDMIEAMRRSGIDPKLIYAFDKSGLLITEDNVWLADPGEVSEYFAAIALYEDTHRFDED